MKLCYIEDSCGGLICYENQKELFLTYPGATICCEGEKKDLECYLGYEIQENNISYVKAV